MIFRGFPALIGVADSGLPVAGGKDSLQIQQAQLRRKKIDISSCFPISEPPE